MRPPLSQAQLQKTVQPLLAELKAVFRILEAESIQIVNAAVTADRSAADLERELLALFDENESPIAKAGGKKKAPVRALDRAALEKKYGWSGKAYGKLVQDILKENNRKTAEAVLTTDKQKLQRNIKAIRPKTARGKDVNLPDVSNVVRRSASIVKAAESGRLMSKTQRNEIQSILRDVLIENGITTGTGRVRKDVAAKFKTRLRKHYEKYSKNDPKTGIPKNLETIAWTETRRIINNVRHEYMGAVARSKSLKQSGMMVTKTWHQNKSIAKDPRSTHSELHGQTIPFEAEFKVAGLYKAVGPYDPRLPAEESIGCHCEIIYRIVLIQEAKAA